jgi:hypothetical protein
MKKLDGLERRIEAIEVRNRLVETNKAWETSLVRKFCIAILTYIVVCSYLALIVHIDPWINAVVPTLGFLLSTTSLDLIKKFWIKHVNDK